MNWIKVDLLSTQTKESVCFSEGTPCVATGWGRIDSQINSFPDMLQEVAVKVTAPLVIVTLNNLD